MSFQPFSVQCQTCGSRLRVSDPKLVGTIAACPKCNSMVQIEQTVDEAAPQQVAVGSAGVDSQAITQESITSEPSDSSTISDAHGFSGEAANGSDQLGRPDWQSARTRRTRQIALVSLVSATGLMAAIVVFVWFVRSFRDEPVAMEPNPPAVGSEPDEATEETNPSTQGSDPEDSEAIDDAGNPETAAEQATANADETNTADSVAESDMPAEAFDPANPPNDLIPQSPLDGPIIPTQPDDASALLPVDPLAPEEDPDKDTGSMQALPPELEKYTKFLLDEGQTDEATLPAPPTMDDVEIDAAAAQDFNFLGRAEPRELNLKADLGIRMALASDGYALADLVLLVSHATGVPIQIDWVSFDLAGIEVTRRINTGKSWQTARELLDNAAASVGGELREEKTIVVLTLTDETFQQTMDGISDLQDFGEGKASAIRSLNTFLGANPEQATLSLGETREQRQLAGLAIEGMRRMRGVAAKVPDAALQHWAAGVEQSVEWPIVTGGQAGPQQDSPIAVASFLRRTARRNQSTCVVNWYDAIIRGAAPEFTLIPHAKQDAATTLQKALEPFELQVRQVDDSHWWVGSEPTYDRLTAVVWTQPLGDSKQVFLQRLENIMQGASADSYRMAYDEDSDRALMLLPRFIVRQLPKITPSIAAK